MSAPAVSILLTTYNRCALLEGAIASVLCQSFTDYELVVMDDASSDGTEQLMAGYSDPRIKYIRAPENTGQKTGDTPIVRKFLKEHCRATKALHFNDDDEFADPSLLSREIEAFERHPSVAVVIGGVVQKYPHPVEPFPPNAPYITNHFDADTVFAQGVFPSGFIESREFLRLFAEDPTNRNIVCGAMMFDLTKVPLVDYFGEGFGAQAGAAMICGAATHGDCFFIDEPMLINRVEKNCMSFANSQGENFRQCLASVNAAFEGTKDFADIRETMMKSYFKAYLSNKVAHRLGLFKSNPLGDIADIFEPPIQASEFADALRGYGVMLSEENRTAIALADDTPEKISAVGFPAIWRMCDTRGISTDEAQRIWAGC